ncbi:phytoene desaturase family protein [Desulfolutivibrio sp.]|uniref:phytoene desaturase family protein n=1 Tax=Desulfolutivibrio sp. TaxID=2773296 RepID=UPI002F96BFB3
MNKIKTVGIIGSGVAGLSAGGLLSRKGLTVRLFEANDKIGGCCSTTNIGGYTFNDGALYLGLPGIMDHVFSKIGLDRPSLLPLRRITAPQTTILPDGTVVDFAAGLAVTIERDHCETDGTRLRRELDDMMGKWEPVLRLFVDHLLLHPFSLPRFLFEGGHHLLKLRGTVASELDRLISDDAVRSAMSGALLYTGMPPQKMPVASILGLIAMFSEGFYLPEGGMGKIPEALSQSLLTHGGKISLNSKVEGIVVRNGRVCGMEVHGQGLVEVDAIISTVSGMLTFGTLLHSEDVPTSMKRMVRKAPLSHKAVAIQLGLSNKIDARSHSNCYFPMMKDQVAFFEPENTYKINWFMHSVPTVTMPELAPENGSIIEMFPPINQHIPFDAWDEKKKESMLQSSISALSRIYNMDIAVTRVISPYEFQSRLHLYNGSVYGLSPAAGPMAQFPQKTAIHGLYQAGQTTYPGYGIGPAAMSGILAAEALLAT